MSFTVKYDSENHFILSTYKGEIDSSTINKSRTEAALLVKQHNCFNILADLREGVTNVSVTEIFNQPKKTTELFNEMGLEIIKFRRAMVINQDSEATSFYETVAINRGHMVKLFYNMDEAKKWLLKNNDS